VRDERPDWLGLYHGRPPRVGPVRVRAARAKRLSALGYEQPTAEQRRETLARNVALLPWPR